MAKRAAKAATNETENKNSATAREEKTVNNTNEFALTTPATATPATVAETAAHIVNDDSPNFIVDLTSRQTSYCSLDAETPEQKKALFNAQNNSAKRLADCINETIKVQHVFVEVVNCINKETGEVNICPRIVLIDDAGVGYACVSLGIFGAVKKMFYVFGEPRTWSEPVTIKVKQITKDTKKMLSFDVI